MVLLWLLLSFAQTARSEEAKLFSLNFKDVDIRALIETVADATGKNFVIDPRITGNITVVTSTPMRASQVYDVFLSILKVHGFAAVTTGGIIKIVPTQSAKQDGDPGELKQIIRGGDEQQTRIVQLHHVDAGQLVQTLLPLMPQYAFLAAVPESNNLIISDTAANVARLEAMVSQVDKSDAQVLEVIQLQHASAADLIQPINNLIATINAGKATATAPPMVADERTNSIIIGGHPDTRLQMRTLIASLDGPIEKDGNTEVIYLRFAKAKEMVETLTGVGSAKDDKAEKPKTKASTDKNFDIRADEAINALIITAPSDVMRNLKQVIRQLDIRRAQVHIEAIIAEVTYDKLQQLGVEWQTDIDGPGGIVAGRTRGGRDSLDLAAFATSLGKGMNIGYLAGSELKALINAFASNTNVNILSTPSLVTLDNEEASIMVGENIPLTTGQFAPAPGINQPFNTIQRQDVGIKLKVLPQINEGDAVKLKVTQEVSSVTGPERFTKRQIETSVLVDDGRILVMGGLIEDKVNETVDSVPLLGDIPLLGYLFRTTNTSVKKTNLMVFLRPQIIRDTRQSGEVTQDKYHAIREKQQKFIEEGLHLMPDEPQPLLESLPDAGGDEASVGQP
ncbi:MAG: type II secretion system secretin GspD [Methylomonas sp.]|nr:type II secretion system secretin GspD [Methylomonas sp.]PPD21468.1 MAG: type II secretion system protein GspD [Methylomonas sp.]PPD24902.1 MAG: type II secretion system protein GspD [Methylomonas sp.]PPD33897.1 MAG: type II secretion system protein GspD [Methylomonas sp.]PPD41466.1 MAG: type II secretion system protein GspD [Methylomonas sp.]